MIADLEVRGTAVDAPTAVRPLSLLDYPHKSYYWIDPPQVLPDSKKWPMLTTRMKRKDEKLQELLSIPVEIKRRKINSVEKMPFEVNQYPLPTYKILSDIYKNQSKTLEDMKESLFGSYSYDYDKNAESLFDLSVLYPYMSNAYKKLYGQHMDNLKEISKNCKNLQSKSGKPGERKTIRIKGTVAYLESIET